MFIAALFTVARTWKPKCPLTEEWIKKMWYIYTMEYYSAIKKNKIMPFAATWIDLEIVILKSDTERQISYDITYMWNLKKGGGTNELIYKTEVESRMQKTNLWLPGDGGGINCDTGTDIHTLLYIK